MKDIPSGAVRRFTFSPERDVRPLISPDGSRVAFYRQLDNDKTRAIYVMPLEGGAEEKILESDEFGNIFCWSSDGRKVLYKWGEPPRVSTVDVETREITHVLHIPKAQVGAPQLAPDDRWISFVLHRERGDRTLYIAPLREGVATGESEWIPIAKSAKEHSPSRNWWSPNGQLLYFLAKGQALSSVWAQPLDPVTKQPLGSAFEVLRPPAQRLELNSLSGYGLASTQLYQAMKERTANIWLAEPVEPK